jgi:hypothetical protein
MTPFDTQKIRIDLREQIQQTEQEIEQKPSLDAQNLVGWLKSKLSFYENGWHRVYERQNNAAKYPPVQFTREPDEGLL